MKKATISIALLSILLAACSSGVASNNDELTQQYGVVTIYKEPT